MQDISPRAQSVMLYTAFLQPCFIPWKLVAALLKEPDWVRFEEVVDELI